MITVTIKIYQAGAPVNFQGDESKVVLVTFEAESSGQVSAHERNMSSLLHVAVKTALEAEGRRCSGVEIVERGKP